MPQFAPRRSQPLKPDSYRRLARLVRSYADRLDAAADRETPQQRKAITDAVSGLHKLSRHYWHRHAGRSPGVEDREAFGGRLALDRERGL